MPAKNSITISVSDEFMKILHEFKDKENSYVHTDAEAVIFACHATFKRLGYIRLKKGEFAPWDKFLPKRGGKRTGAGRKKQAD